jgi:WD40 repeat protein
MTSLRSPFKFLDSYTKNDHEIFFGRDREVEELYHRVFESKIMLVYGVSGTGKSSLIHCGLANKFQETDWLPIVIRRGGNIIENMASGIKAASITAQQSQLISPADFKKGVRSLYLDHYKPVFFIFDQFEELFIFGDKEERRQFIHIVKALIESDLQCRIIFVMREEYMAGVTEFEKFIPIFFSNRVRIEKMSHRNALEAIKGPCKVSDISIEEGFAESLLEKLSPGSEDVELTYLQVFLDKIFRLASEDKKPGTDQLSFTLSHLYKTGNVSDLLGSFLDDQIALMEDPETAMSVLKAFVSGKGTKRPASDQEAMDIIRSLGKEMTPEKLKGLIQSFVKLRVLRDKDDNGRYELRHDALAEKVYEKFSTAEKELLEIRQFIENSYQASLKRKILLNNDDLNYISNKDSLLNLNPELQQFLNESRKHQEARKKGIKILTIISAFAFVLLLSTIAYTLINRSKKSESIFLAKESITQFTRPRDRLCLAGLAGGIHQGDEAKEALLKAFDNVLRNPGDDKGLIGLRQKYLIKYSHVSLPIEIAACSKDNRFIYGCTSDSIFLWMRNGLRYSAFPHGTSPLVYLLMSNDGEYFGAVNKDTILTVWDKDGKVKFSRKTAYNSINTNQIFRFSSDNRIIAVSTDKDADLLDINGNLLQSFNLHKGNVNAVDFSDDGKFIASAGNDSTVNIWHFNSDLKKFDLYNSIHSPSDTIFSVDFAKNCKHILTSAVNMIRVTDVNGQITWGIRGYFVGDWVNKINLGYPYFAEFDESGTGFVFRSSLEKNKNNNSFMAGIYVDINEHLVNAGEFCKFDFIIFSPDKKYIAYSNENDISLITRNVYKVSNYVIVNSYRLLQMKGQKPFFSPDCKYVYTINGNRIESWFIDIETISVIALEYYNNWYKYLDQY